MLKQVSPFVLIITLAACSTPIERRQANGNFDYVNVTVKEPLTIPEGLNEPAYNHEFDIPKLGEESNAEFVGDQLDIRPPLQILAMAEGTQVQEGSDNIKIIIESIDNNVDLRDELFTAVNGYLAERKYNVINQDKEKGFIETDWIEQTQVIDTSWFGDDTTYTVRQRYRFDINVRPQGRTGELVINLVDHEERYDGDKVQVLLSSDDKRRYTVDMLNNAVAYIAVKRQKAIKAKQIKESLGISMELVTADSAEAESFWVAKAPFQQTMTRLVNVLPEVGFEVTDLDSDKGLIYVKLNDTSGFWSSLFGRDEELPLEDGEYRLLLQERDNGKETDIHLRTTDDEPLDNAVIENVYNKLSEEMNKSINTRPRR